MRCGIVLPFLDAADVAEAGVLAERHGWDGIFLAESVWGVDAWIALTAAAMRTTRIRLGTMLTPLPRFKPLAVYDGLMRGQPFEFAGERYVVRPTDFYPPDPPVQRPRVPVWVVGAYPGGRSLRRAVRWDGLVPNVRDDAGVRGPANPEELAEVVGAARSLRTEAGLSWDGYDVVAEGVTAPGDSARGWSDAGATWWIESDWSQPPGPDGIAALHRRISGGPPR